MEKRSLAFLLLLILLGVAAAAQDTTQPPDEPVSATQEPVRYYINVAIARVRAEPNTTSEVVGRLRRGTPIQVVETVEGEKIGNSTKWYRLVVPLPDAVYFGGYIHSSLVTANPPATPTPVVGGQGLDPVPLSGTWAVLACGTGTIGIIVDEGGGGLTRVTRGGSFYHARIAPGIYEHQGSRGNSTLKVVNPRNMLFSSPLCSPSAMQYVGP